MIIPLLLSAILVFHNLPSVLSLVEGESCTTPNGEGALCTRIRECPVIGNAIGNKPSSETRRFAKESLCGRTTEPLVCCGSSSVFLLPPVYTHRLLPKPNECGVDLTTDKIILGEETGLAEFPWMALLSYKDFGETHKYFACGGSLINKRYVLTAAHCIYKLRSRELVDVRLGEHNIGTDRDCTGKIGYEVCNPPAMNYGIESTIPHPDYLQRRKVHDIALLRLNRDVVFADHIQPVCLPAESSPMQIGNNVTVAGWGETETDTDSKVKLKAKLVVLSQTACLDQFNAGQVVITDTQLCAQGFCETFGKTRKICTDTCRGDSGGPSVRKIPNTSQWVIEGITSFGASICGQKSNPAVYTRVSKYVKWIGDNIRD